MLYLGSSLSPVVTFQPRAAGQFPLEREASVPRSFTPYYLAVVGKLASIRADVEVRPGMERRDPFLESHQAEAARLRFLCFDP
jgi:hypothetical protein